MGDIVEWYLRSYGSRYDIHGRVAKADQQEGQDREEILTKQKKIGQIAVKGCNDCYTITLLDNKGNFTIEGPEGQYRIPYYESDGSWFKGYSPSTDLLDIAFEHIGTSKKLRQLDNRNHDDIDMARGHGRRNRNSTHNSGINYRDGKLSVNLGSLTMTGGTQQLRYECNKNGISCRSPNGKLLTNRQMKDKLRRL